MGNIVCKLFIIRCDLCWKIKIFILIFLTFTGISLIFNLWNLYLWIWRKCYFSMDYDHCSICSKWILLIWIIYHIKFIYITWKQESWISIWYRLGYIIIICCYWQYLFSISCWAFGIVYFFYLHCYHIGCSFNRIFVCSIENKLSEWLWNNYQ